MTPEARSWVFWHMAGIAVMWGTTYLTGVPLFYPVGVTFAWGIPAALHVVEVRRRERLSAAVHDFTTAARIVIEKARAERETQP